MQELVLRQVVHNTSLLLADTDRLKNVLRNRDTSISIQES